MITEVIRHGDQLKNVEIERIPVIWGWGGVAFNLYTEMLYTKKKFYIYDVNSVKVDKYKEMIDTETLERLLRENKCLVIIGSSRRKTIDEITERIRNLSADTPVYEYRPYIRADLEKIEKETGFYNGSGMIHIMNPENATMLLKEKLNGLQPFLFSRWGSVEGIIIYNSIAHSYPLWVLDNGFQNAGIFPKTQEMFDRFTDITIKAAEAIDVLCIGFWCQEIDKLFCMYSPKASLVPSTTIYPFFSDFAWTEALEGKKVLVIHPFAELIDNQYKRREFIFKENILPQFDIKTYKAVQSIGGNDEYSDWEAALEKMKEDISKIDFECALLGCGAYGMPLGAFIKTELKRKAIHMGGSLQILFGIKGKRWEGPGYNYDEKLYNEYWVRPGDNLKPATYQNVEGGCYW